jgi:hypothetical protein
MPEPEAGKEAPIQMQAQRIPKNQIRSWERILWDENGSPSYEKTSETLGWDGEKFVVISTKTESLTLAQKGFVKELELQMILGRTIGSEKDFKEHGQYFLAKFHMQISKAKAARNAYLKLTTKGRPYVYVFQQAMGGAYSQEVGFNGGDSGFVEVEKLEEETKISIKEATNLLRTRKALGVYAQNPASGEFERRLDY